MSALVPGALARAAETTRLGQHPLALLDLDLTLIDNSPRTRFILGKWCEGLAGRLPETTVAAMTERAKDMPLVFSIRDNIWRVLGIESELSAPDELIPLAKEGLLLWRRLFFDPTSLVHDLALPRAVDTVKTLVEHGVTVAYVTARSVALAPATVASLHSLGFPVASLHTLLLTNDDPTCSDHDSKVRALDFCGRLGTVILNAENEPAHANMMHRRFPEALTALIETRHSEPAPPLDPGVVRVASVFDTL